jgi:hypothetical protein
LLRIRIEGASPLRFHPHALHCSHNILLLREKSVSQRCSPLKILIHLLDDARKDY